jgi:hypothetical protein
MLPEKFIVSVKTLRNVAAYKFFTILMKSLTSHSVQWDATLVKTAGKLFDEMSQAMLRTP